MNINHLRVISAFVVALFLSLAGPFWVFAGGGKNSSPPAASALFRDFPADRVTSDSQGIYLNGKDCTTVTVFTSSFLLRTVKKGCTRGTQRRVNIDFTGTAVVGDGYCPFMQCPATVNDDFGQLGELNACGLNSLADVTVYCPTMFRDTAFNELHAVDIKMNLEPDFTNTAFILRYGAYVRPGNTSNQRILTTDADPNDPINKPDRGRAALIKITNGGQYVCLGEFYMPLAITVAK